MNIVNRFITVSGEDGTDLADLTGEGVINDIPNSYVEYMVAYTGTIKVENRSDDERLYIITVTISQSLNGEVLFSDTEELEINIPSGFQEVDGAVKIPNVERFLFSDMDYTIEVEAEGTTLLEFDGDQDFSIGVKIPARTV